MVGPPWSFLITFSEKSSVFNLSMLLYITLHTGMGLDVLLASRFGSWQKLYQHLHDILYITLAERRQDELNSW